MRLKKEYLIILIIQITEVMGFSLILPFLPLFARDLGASPLTIGLILTSFSLFQFISAPIMGRLSDHYGRKPMLIISQLSTMISFIILGFANSIWLIFLSRIVDGLFGSNFTIAQAYLSDISTKKDRSKVFGLTGVAFGFGFMVGPAVGGSLSRFGYSLPSFIAAGITFITILTTHFLLKETVKRKKDIKISIKIFEFSYFKKYFSSKKISPKLWALFSFLLGHQIWVSTLALYAAKQLGFGAQEVGFVLMYIGIISIVIRGFLLPKLIDWIGEKRLTYIGLGSMILGMLIILLVRTWPFLLVAVSFFSFGGGAARPLLTGAISNSVSGKEQGAILGLSNSLGSISQIFGPLIGGLVINYFIPGILGLTSALVIAIGLFMMLRYEKKISSGKKYF